MNAAIKNPVNWAVGTALCALGTCFCTKANFGLSMLGAPPYILHVFFSRFFPWYTQGRSEYIWQGLILIALCLTVRRFKPRYLLSFGTSVLAGMIIDGWFLLLGGNAPYASVAARVASYLVGQPLIALGVAFMFRTEWPVQICDLAVTEIVKTYHWNTGKTKLIYDLIMLVTAVTLSLTLTHALTGIGVATVIAAFCTAPMITVFCKLIDKIEKNKPEEEK